MVHLNCRMYATISLVFIVLAMVEAGKRDYCNQVCKPMQIFDERCCYKYGICCSGTRKEDPNYWSEANIAPNGGNTLDSEFAPADKVNHRYSGNNFPNWRTYEENALEPRVFHKETPRQYRDDGQQPYAY